MNGKVVTQISVFIENKPGHMMPLLEALAEHELNIRALSIADTADFGIVRMIFEEPEEALRAIREAGFTARTNDVLRVEVPDQPGGLLDAVVRPLASASINIEYIYAFADNPLTTAAVVLKVDDAERALEALV